MSNRSLMQRLREALGAFEAEKISAREFSAVLFDISEAFEGIPYSIIRDVGTFRHRIEVCGYNEEEETVSDRSAIAIQLRDWLNQVEDVIIQK
jgi:hypothetical protein